MIDGKGLSEAVFNELMYQAMYDLQCQVKRQKGTIEWQEKEIKRLREALKDISKHPYVPGEIARKALGY